MGGGVSRQEPKPNYNGNFIVENYEMKSHFRKCFKFRFVSEFICVHLLDELRSYVINMYVIVYGTEYIYQVIWDMDIRVGHTIQIRKG